MLEPARVSSLAAVRGAAANGSARRAQAVDIARTIWGDPITTRDLEQAVLADGALAAGKPRIVRYWALEEDAVRC